MAKRRRKNNRKWIVTGLFLALIIGAGVVCFLVWESYFKEKEIVKEPGASGVVEVVKTEEKEETGSEKPDKVVEKEEVIQYEGENPNLSDDLTGAVTYAGATDGILRIRVNIDQYLSGGGCHLALMRNGVMIYSEEVGIVDAASTSTCEGFDVRTAGLGSGTVQIVVTINSGGKVGTIKGEANL